MLLYVKWKLKADFSSAIMTTPNPNPNTVYLFYLRVQTHLSLGVSSITFELLKLLQLSLTAYLAVFLANINLLWVRVLSNYGLPLVDISLILV